MQSVMHLIYEENIKSDGERGVVGEGGGSLITFPHLVLNIKHVLDRSFGIYLIVYIVESMGFKIDRPFIHLLT